MLKREEITSETSSSLIINLNVNFREKIKKNFAELNCTNEINEAEIS